MAHVRIRIGTVVGDPRPAQVVVDGLDITKSVLAEGFAVHVQQGSPGVPRGVVTMQLAADHLDMELPDSILQLVNDTEA